jgi:hypothetical protein
MKLTHFQIQFDNPHGVFAAGEKVSGQIMLNLAKPMKMRSKLDSSCIDLLYTYYSSNVGLSFLAPWFRLSAVLLKP